MFVQEARKEGHACRRHGMVTERPFCLTGSNEMPRRQPVEFAGRENVHTRITVPIPNAYPRDTRHSRRGQFRITVNSALHGIPSSRDSQTRPVECLRVPVERFTPVWCAQHHVLTPTASAQRWRARRRASAHTARFASAAAVTAVLRFGSFPPPSAGTSAPLSMLRTAYKSHRKPVSR